MAAYLEALGSWTVALGVVVIGGYIGWKYISKRRFLRKINIARITPEELKTKLDGGEEMIVVDVRDRIDFESEPAIIPGALHLTVDELDLRHKEIPREREIVLYCTCPSEETSARAALLLEEARDRADPAARRRLSRLARSRLPDDGAHEEGSAGADPDAGHHRRLQCLIRSSSWSITIPRP